MNKTDKIFLSVIHDKQLVNTFDIEPDKYTCLEDGKRAGHPYVKAIAEIIEQLNKLVSQAESDMRLQRLTGPVTLDESEFQTLYKKVISNLTT